jgi:hypothetical protein
MTRLKNMPPHGSRPRPAGNPLVLHRRGIFAGLALPDKASALLDNPGVGRLFLGG